MLWNMIKNRLGEASTWKAILSVAVGVGLKLSDAQMDAITSAMLAVYVALSLLLPDTFGKSQKAYDTDKKE